MEHRLVAFDGIEDEIIVVLTMYTEKLEILRDIVRDTSLLGYTYEAFILQLQSLR